MKHQIMLCLVRFTWFLQDKQRACMFFHFITITREKIVVQLSFLNQPQEKHTYEHSQSSKRAPWCHCSKHQTIQMAKNWTTRGGHSDSFSKLKTKSKPTVLLVIFYQWALYLNLTVNIEMTEYSRLVQMELLTTGGRIPRGLFRELFRL